MAKDPLANHESRNALLSKLPIEQFEGLHRGLQSVELKVQRVLYEPYRPIRYAYFPESGMISIVSIMKSGESIEVGTIGREGMAGSVLLLETNNVPYRYFTQVSGNAQRIDAARLKEEAEQHPEVRKLILRYEAAFLTQSMQGAACNGLHTVQQRCCRWLLMVRDRIDSDELTLTQEFLAMMLSVRRASVSDVLRPLQEAGFISSNRGKIKYSIGRVWKQAPANATE